MLFVFTKVQWCSGYHARFTRERSRVRPPVEPSFIFHQLAKRQNKTDTTGGVRTHAEILPLDLKSNALTTRPPWC